MKSLCTLVLLSILALSCFSQSAKPKQIIKTIVQPRSVYLNGGARASVGGKSRVTVEVDLPPNTISWYYSFSTSPGQSGTKVLNLALQLSSIVENPLGVLGAGNVSVPPGSHSLDVYLMDQNNSDLFMQKVDNNGGTFSYNRQGTVMNTKQAVVNIDKVTSGTVYLGLKNPSTLDGLNVSIEVVAVVEE